MNVALMKKYNNFGSVETCGCYFLGSKVSKQENCPKSSARKIKRRVRLVERNLSLAIKNYIGVSWISLELDNLRISIRNYLI